MLNCLPEIQTKAQNGSNPRGINGPKKTRTIYVERHLAMIRFEKKGSLAELPNLIWPPQNGQSLTQ